MQHIATQNINYAIVFRLMGWLLNIEACFMLLPLAIAFAYGESEVGLAFLYSTLATGLVGLAMSVLIKPRSRSMQTREGLLLTSVVWVFFSAFGMLPFLITGTLTSVTDAFFECMSGFTTTGASVLRDVSGTSHGLLFWRALMQWIGGMGIILFTLAVLPMLNSRGGIAMFNAEVTGITKERLRPRVSQSAMSLWGLYVAITAVMAVALMLGPMNWFDALCHTLATVSTGGFSTHTTALTEADYYSRAVVMLFMYVCGVNFALLFKCTRGDFKSLAVSDVWRCYSGVALLLGLMAAVHLGVITGSRNWGHNLIDGLFAVLSAMTSTGFADYDYGLAGGFVSLMLLVCIFFGGSAGSTSGGAKIDRMLVLLKNVKNEFYRALHPNAVTAVRVQRRAMTPQSVNKVMAFLFVYVLLIMVSAAVLSLMGISLTDAAFTSLSAVSNIGLSSSHGGTFALLPDAAKWLVSFDMLVGRLELFTVLVMFTKNFWVKD